MNKSKFLFSERYGVASKVMKDYGAIDINFVTGEAKRDYAKAAALLETADELLQKTVDAIKEQKSKAESEENLLDMEIDSISLQTYLDKNFDMPYKNFNGRDGLIVQELKNFGLTKIRNIADLIKNIKFVNDSVYTNYLGLLRALMMVADTGKYFAESWTGDWTGIGATEISFYEKRSIDIKKYLETYGLSAMGVNT